MTSSPRLLLARPDHLGDVLLTLPAATALRRALPGASLTYLVARGLEEAALRCPAIDAVIGLPFPPPDAPSSPAGWPDVVEREASTLTGRFDAVLFLRPNDPWSGALAAAARIPLRVGYDQPGTLPFVTHAIREPRDCHAVTLALHLALRAVEQLATSSWLALDALQALFDEQVGDTMPCFAPEPDEDSRVARILDGSGTGAGAIVLHPGSGWRLKNWPLERWGILARSLCRELGVRPLAVGGPGEEATIATLERLSLGTARGLTGLTLGELGALHRRARLVVSTDSGALHLAAMVGAPVVGLYGPADPRLAGPWCPSERSRIVRVILPCSPCGALEQPPCGAASLPACVTAITVGDVLAAAADLLEAGASGSRG